MKNNIAFKLALSSIKKDKKSYIISFIMMLIAFLSAMIIPSSLDAYERIHLLLLKKDYGNWIVCYQDLNEVSRKFLEINGAVDKCIDLSYIGRLKNNNYIANYNEDFFDIASIELKEGRLPENEDEIIAVRYESHDINEVIKVTYYTDQEYTKEYKVVGVINDYNEKWSTPSPDYFTYNNPEYKNYTYITSDHFIDGFQEFNENCIYNFSVFGKDVQYIKGGEISYNAVNYGLTIFSNKTDYINLFIGLLSVGLLLVVFRDSHQREKTVFLLRCIGMSKRDMKKYIFYEIIMIALIALGISFVFGSITLLIISLYYKSIYHFFFFFDLLSISLKYVLTIFFIITCIIYISILPISVRMMDSLIHKKERTQLKKYHITRRMNVLNIARKVAGSCMGYIFATGIIIAMLTTQTFSIKESIEHIHEDIGPTKATYEYSSPYLTDDFFEEYKGTIVNYKNIKTSSHHVEYDSYYSSSNTFVSLESVEDLDDRLLEGRLPIHENECLVYDFDDYINYLYKYSIGDTVSITKTWFNDETNQQESECIKEYKVVGIIDMDDYCDLDRRYIWDMSNIGFVILEDSLPENQEFEISSWETQSYLLSTKDIFLHVHDYLSFETHGTNRNENNEYYYEALKFTYNEHEDAIYELAFLLLVFILAIYYLVIITKSLIQSVNKDLKLIRCLGMTFKQSMFVYVWISFLIILITFIYNYIIQNVNSRIKEEFILSISVMMIILLIYLIVFLIFAYRKMDKTVAFYPTEVERYY